MPNQSPQVERPTFTILVIWFLLILLFGEQTLACVALGETCGCGSPHYCTAAPLGCGSAKRSEFYSEVLKPFRLLESPSPTQISHQKRGDIDTCGICCTGTCTRLLRILGVDIYLCEDSNATITATPTASPSLSPNPSSTVTGTPTLSPTVSSSLTPTPTSTSTPSATPSPSSTPSSTSSVTVTPSASPTFSISSSPTPTPFVSVSPTGTSTATNSLTPTQTTITTTPSFTITPTSSLSQSPPTVTPSPSLSSEGGESPAAGNSNLPVDSSETTLNWVSAGNKESIEVAITLNNGSSTVGKVTVLQDTVREGSKLIITEPQSPGDTVVSDYGKDDNPVTLRLSARVNITIEHAVGSEGHGEEKREEPMIASSMLNSYWSYVSSSSTSSSEFTLRHKIEICFNLTETIRQQLDSRHPSTVCLAYLNETTNQWHCVDPVLLFPNNHTVCGYTPHLTTFAIVAGSTPPSSSNDVNDNDRNSKWVPVVAGSLVGVVVVITLVTVLLLWKKPTWGRHAMVLDLNHPEAAKHNLLDE